MSAQSYLGLPPIPPELKSITSFIQRADELRVQDPVIAYWCAYYAAQQGISLKVTGPSTRKFLSDLLSALEHLRSTIGPSEAVDIESVSSVYVEDFALRVFTVADNEDRSGKSNRNTAKKFLAAATFLEVLRVFDDQRPWESHSDKARYAKWKAADIAKAFREGRVPAPGPAPAIPAARSSPLDSFHDDTQAVKDRASNAGSMDGTSASAGMPTGISASRTSSGSAFEDEGFSEFPSPQKQSPPSHTADPRLLASEDVTEGIYQSPHASAGSSSSNKRRSRSTSLSLQSPDDPLSMQRSSVRNGRNRTTSVSSSHSGRSAGSVGKNAVSPTHSLQRDLNFSNLSSNVYPSAPGHPSLPTQSQSPSQPYSASRNPLSPSAPQLPPTSVLSQTPSSKSLEPPQELTPSIIAKAQKHCRFAISALDYEDASQARKELLAALQLLGDV